ncbi:Ger(x)C family spore germination protein [Bacillus sp. BRMEA1]|uniref:Ger(x)C family spore germination protein n=1 Tax=Neobacillus endophyticus TaxID=2738405 RepID=UPI001564DEDC|nr:Ger(x)C family spore germination protein [Neobacillus endophyticus]NRD79330.1 Ger(x)C family spore germination protein [Neobacillus endophyticus]
MKKWTLDLLVLVFSSVLLVGCWNQRELTELAFVMAMGVDKGKGKEKYDVSFQVVVPANVSSGQEGGGGQGPPVVVYKSSGNNLTEAARKATKQIPRILYYAHTTIFVISEEVAKEGIFDLLDALDRDPEFRTTTFAIIAKDGKAIDLISSLTNLDKLPVNKFSKTLEATEEMLGENMKVNIDDVLSNSISTGKETVISGFKMLGDVKKGKSPQNIDTTRPPSMLVADGLAVFKRGKLVSWLSRDKVRGAIWVLGKMQGTDINIDMNGKANAISITPYLSDTNVSVTVKKGKPVINVYIKTVFKLSEVNTAFDITNPLNMKIIEKKVQSQIKRDIDMSIRTVKKYNSDIFGFGEKIHKENPKLWKKLESDWENQFSQLQVNVKVDAYYREAGKRNNPFWMDMKK